jgi:acetyl esterase/lipase
VGRIVASAGFHVANLEYRLGPEHPSPAAVACLSPWVDLTQTAPFHLGAADPRDELASPLFATDLTGLPPFRIDVDELEVPLEDSNRLAGSLGTAGVEVDLTVWPGMIHVFQAFRASSFRKRT